MENYNYFDPEDTSIILGNYPIQIIILTEMIVWTEKVTNYLINGDKDEMEELQKFYN